MDFLVAVRLLSDLLSGQDCIRLETEMCGVRHGSEVVAATVETQVDDEFVRMLLLDQVEKPLRLLAQTFLPAKAAVDGVGVRQIGVPGATAWMSMVNSWPLSPASV